MPDRLEEDIHPADQDAQPDPLSEVIKPVGEEPEPPSEITGYIEQVEKRGEQAGPVPTDDSGQPLVQTAPQSQYQLPNDAVVLPMTKQQFEIGLHEQLWRSARWLAEWCVYIIKKFGNKVFFPG